MVQRQPGIITPVSWSQLHTRCDLAQNLTGEPPLDTEQGHLRLPSPSGVNGLHPALAAPPLLQRLIINHP